jgi:WD40 repeat protein
MQDGKSILSGSFDGTMRLWRAESDKPLATLIPVDKDDWVVVTPDGRFDASPGAEKWMHYVVNTSEGAYQVLPLEQFKSRYYEAGLLQKLIRS